MLREARKTTPADRMLRSLLKSNNPPSEAEERATSELLHAAKEKEELQRKEVLWSSLALGELDHVTANLRRRLQSTSQVVQQYKAIASPIRSLPPEIVQLIFSHFADSNSPTRWKHFSGVPWALGQVCKSWRANALATPKLWAHLPGVDMLTTAPNRLRTLRILSVYKELIRRSEGVPLIFSVEYGQHTGLRHVRSLIRLLVGQCERWGNVTFNLPLLVFERLRPIKGRLSLLQSLSLTTDTRGFLAQSPIDMFASAPKLREVCMSGLGGFEELMLPFEQLLTYRHCFTRPLLLFSRILTSQVASSLQTLSLHMADFASPLPSITLPQLKALLINSYTSRDADFAISLTIPAIETVEYSSYDEMLPASLHTLLSNGKPSPCTLTRLAYRFEMHDNIDPDIFTTLLGSTPNLECLDAPIPPVFDLYRLAYCLDLDAVRPIAPKLRTCRFFVPREEMLTSEHAVVLNKLASRRFKGEGMKDGNPTRRSVQPRTIEELWVYTELGHVGLHLSEWLNKNPEDEHKFPDTDKDYRSMCNRTIRLEQFLLVAFGSRTKPYKLPKKVRVQLQAIMDDIEVCVVHDVWILYHSRIYIPMKALSELNIPSLSIRARTLVTQWRARLQAYLIPGLLRWAFRGSETRCLAYISPEDPIRKSPNALDLVHPPIDIDTLDESMWHTRLGQEKTWPIEPF